MFCKICNKNLIRCDTCNEKYCINCINYIKNSELSLSILLDPSYLHRKCLECNEKLVCTPTNVCTFCFNKSPSHIIYFINEKSYISLGNVYTSYEKFDIIVNLNFPENGVKFGEISTVKYNSGKIVIYCGLEDNSHPSLEKYTRIIFNRLIDTIYQELESKLTLPRILFHCYAGISRSATLSILFLSDYLNLKNEEVYSIVKSKRKCILPNKLFLKILNNE